MLTVTGGFTNSGTLDLDILNQDGVGKLTICTTLANTGNVQIGPNNSSLSAATTLTVGGLTNASGANFQMFGSASHPVTLAFSGSGSGFTSNAGFFLLSNFTSLTLHRPLSTLFPYTTLFRSMLTVTGGFTNSGTLDLDILNQD